MTQRLKRHLFILAACGSALAQSGPKLEFEVASIKAAAPPAPFTLGVGCHGGPGTSDPGLFTCTLTLMNFISRAYSLRSFQISAPDWTQHQPAFEIKATVPPGTTAEQFNVMLQNLLIDRFKMSVHREPRELSRYKLVVAEGGVKFKEAKDEAAEPAPPPAPPQTHPPRIAGCPLAFIEWSRARTATRSRAAPARRVPTAAPDTISPRGRCKAC